HRATRDLDAMWVESSTVSRRIQAVNSRRPWRVAVLGLGHWYSAFGLARGLREYPKAELVAAAWDNERQLEAFTRTFGVKGYRDYGELLERERVDILHLAGPVAQPDRRASVSPER